MASLVQEPNSPFWYLKFRDPNGKWRRKATPYRVGVGSDTRKARELCAEQALKESRSPVYALREQWNSWAPAYLTALQRNPLTILRYQGAWEHLAEYMREKNVPTPRDLTYVLCKEYLPWRKKQPARKNPKKKASHNTALFELKVLSQIMGEAVRRGFAPGNVCRELRVSREQGRAKPALTNDQITQIREGLKTRPAWMAHAFEIAIHHGCRISECRVPMSNIHLCADVPFIHFGKTKGDKPFTVPIHDGIMPLIQERIEAGAEYLADVPLRNAPKLFHQFFKALGMGGVSFHCTRVTVATWLAQSDLVPEKKAMRFLNHANELVHRSYQRWRPSDVSDVLKAVTPPPLYP